MRRHRMSALVVLSLFSLVGCGNRLSHSAIVTAARGSGAGGAGALSGALGDPGGQASDIGGGLDASTAGGAAGSASSGLGGAGGTGGKAGPGGGAASSAAAVAGGGSGTKAPIVIGSVGTYSGTVGQSDIGGVKAVQAWVAQVNARGGLNGHPVKYIVQDDGGDPAKGRSEVQDLVESKKVIAFVYNSAPLAGQGTVDYLTQKRIPVIGSEGVSEWFYSSPMFFPQMTSGALVSAATTASAASQTIPKGQNKLGLMTCSDGIDICESAKKTVPQWAPKFGYTYVWTGNASLAQPDYTAECLAARNAGAQVITFAMDANSIMRFAKSCNSVGYHPTFAVSQHVASDELAHEPLVQGVAGTAMVAAWFNKANPGIADFQAALAQYAPGVSPTGSPMFGWTSAKLFEKAAQRLGDQPTAAQVLDGLWSIQNDTLGGLTMPLTFQRDKTAPRPICFYPYTVTGGSYTLVDSGNVHCV